MEEKQQWAEGQTLDISRFTIPLRDEFAIGFVKFINETDSFHHGEDAFHFNGEWHTYEEFLEIYKKEIGL